MDSSLFGGLAADERAVYVAGILVATERTIDKFKLTPAGGVDVLVASYDPATGGANWARRFGNEADQQPAALAVTASGTLAVLGSFTGKIAEGPVTLENPGALPRDFVLGLRASDGSPLWGHAFDTGANGALIAAAANPRGDRIAVCGYASQAAIDLVPGATFGGGTRDAVIAVFDAAGQRVWSRQIGGPEEEECTAVAIDDRGDVFAAGRYTGRFSLTGEPLPVPGSSFRRWLWVGKFEGGSGRPLAQASFGSGAGIHFPRSLAAGPGGALFIAGSMTNTLPFGGKTEPLISVGGADAFAARLDPGSSPPFSPVWAVRLGGRSTDEARDIAVDAHGDVAVTGLFAAETSGAAALHSSLFSTDAFLLRLDGTTGATRAASVYGDENSQAGMKVIFGRRPGTDFIAIGGGFTGTLDFGAAGLLHSNSGASFLLFGE